MSRYGGGQLNGDLPEILIKSLRRTCMSGPAQWEAELLDGGWLYIRCRHGHFTCTVDREKVNPSGVMLVGGKVELVSNFTLGYPIEDCPTTAEMLKMIGAELTTEWEHDDLVRLEAGAMSTSDGLGS